MGKRGRPPLATPKVAIKKPKCDENENNNNRPTTSKRVNKKRNAAKNEKNKVPKPPPMFKVSTRTFELKPKIINHTIVIDMYGRKWRLGGAIGKGSFGEIFLVSNRIDKPVTKHNTKLVCKFEPYDNGPLFVEMHFFLNVQRNSSFFEDFHEPLSTPPNGMPAYITTGTHYFGVGHYRFIIQQRFDYDLYSLVYERCMQPHHILTVANLLIDAIQNIHDKGYVHNDIKAANIMISKVRYYEENKLTGTIRRRRRKRRAFRLNHRKHFVGKRLSPERLPARLFNLTIENQNKRKIIEEERIFLIDYGLASKYMDNGLHRSLIMDYKRAHDGTLEFTSRDAHCGAHSRRSDMECIGYNLLLWSQGYLPWEDDADKCNLEEVHRAKEYLMTDARNLLRSNYGPHVPDFIGEYLSFIAKLSFNERPDYARYKKLFKHAFKKMGLPINTMKVDSDAILRSSFYVSSIPRIKNKMYRSYDVKRYTRIPRRRFNALPKNVRDLELLKFNILAFDPMDIIFMQYDDEVNKMRKTGKFQEDCVRKYEGKPTYAILAAEENCEDKSMTLSRPTTSSFRMYQNPIYRKNLNMAKKMSMLSQRKSLQRTAARKPTVRQNKKNDKTAQENELNAQNNVENVELNTTTSEESIGNGTTDSNE